MKGGNLHKGGEGETPVSSAKAKAAMNEYVVQRARE